MLVAIGLCIGLPAALSSTRLIRHQLFGLKPTDPLTISVATLVLLVVAVFAGYLPARRASRVDPMALRYEYVWIPKTPSGYVISLLAHSK